MLTLNGSTHATMLPLMGPLHITVEHTGQASSLECAPLSVNITVERTAD